MPATTAQNLPAPTFGELLRHLRQRARLTQDELGLAVGYSRAHTARLENGQRMPDPSAVRARFFEPLGLGADSAEATQLVALAAAAHDIGSHDSDEPERPAERQTPNNLPYPVTSFVGRTDALAELQRLLPTTRLLTLTGVGGTGKTRLALELAGRVLDDFPDGVWLVELAPVADPALVPATVLSVLSTPSHPDLTATKSVLNFLTARRVLLILDNCEHVIDAAAQFADAVGRGCGQVRILATSREALNIAGELSWRVPSLSAPPATNTVTPETLARHEAVQLFVERAAFAQPGFAITQANAAVIQQICVRLDGIPLALELAAARIKTLAPEKIAERLSDRFRLLTGGSRTVLPRQQTLQALVDWSYRLLTEPERTLLRRLSVFVGGWTLEAAETVGVGDDIQLGEVLDLHSRLVDKSLVIQDDSGVETRYLFLETIRQFAIEKLAESDEGRNVRDAHISYFLHLGDQVMPELVGEAPTNQAKLIQRLRPDADNIRRASDWAIDSDKIEAGWELLERFFGLFVALNTQNELVERLDGLLKHPKAPRDTRQQARLYLLMSQLQHRHGTLADEAATLEKIAIIGRALDDSEVQSWAEGGANSGLFSNAIARGDTAAAHAHFARWIELKGTDSLNVENDRISLLAMRCSLATAEGDYAQALAAQKLLWEALGHSSNKMLTSAIARAYGQKLLNAGELDEAERYFHISLIDNHSLGDRHAVAACLGSFASVAVSRGHLIKCARLLGASEAIQETLQARLHWSDLRLIDKTQTALHEQITEDELRLSWTAGRVMTLEQAVAYALEDAPGRGPAV